MGAVTRLSAGGGALPVIVSVIGPRETHDHRNYNLVVCCMNTTKRNPPKKKNSPCHPTQLSPWRMPCPIRTLCLHGR